MSQVLQTAKNVFSIPSLKSKVEQERRASVFGMVESGKTTTLLELLAVCTNYANQSNRPGSKENFYFLVEERTSGIRQALGEFYQGMFPEKTPAGERIFEADFLMRFHKTFGKWEIRLPFCETSGEAMSHILDRFRNGQYEITPDMKDAGLIHDYILDTDAIALIAPVTRGLGMEAEKGATVQLPDVNLSRLLSAIYQYKKENPSRPIKGIAVFLTKYDALRTYLETSKMDLQTPDGVHNFMSKYFPQTYDVIGWYGLDNVRFWPTGVQIETERVIDELNTLDPQNPAYKVMPRLHPKNPARGWQIKVDSKRNMPVFTEQPFYEFIEWLKDTVMA